MAVVAVVAVVVVVVVVVVVDGARALLASSLRAPRLTIELTELPGCCHRARGTQRGRRSRPPNWGPHGTSIRRGDDGGLQAVVNAYG
ncbi:MAG TPA: hypothetical protein VMU75_02680 [Acidimicrobiales bacterium]|nr:hypothetical protein [Acidimicrobiales bacterium]